MQTNRKDKEMKNIYFLIVALSCIGSFQPSILRADAHTHFSHQYLNRNYQTKLVQDPTPYLLPANHVLHPILDTIFSTRDVLKNEKTFTNAGFIILRAQKTSGICLASHPKLKGYVIKCYLDSQSIHRSAYSQQDWLIQRCRGAARLKERIKNGNFKNFVVPDKWLYKLPSKAENEDSTFVVVATYMNLVKKKKTASAWKTKPTKKDLRQLFTLMKQGGASPALVINTPRTKEGKFAFIDTEYPDRSFSKDKLTKVTHYFSEKNQRYWSSLIQNEQ